MCVEAGSYMVNFASCSQCKKRGELKVLNKLSQDVNGDEVITYQHVCEACSHVIADHEYVFRIDEGYQVYEMSCLLCGNGEDERSVMPCDPQKQIFF